MPPKIKQSIECWLFSESAGLNALLLLLQAATTEEYPAFWQPITGGMEPGETAEQACRREIWEETGFVVDTKHLALLEPQFDVQIDAHLTVHKILFVATAAGVSVTISHEHIGWQWVPFNQASELLYWPSNQETYVAVRDWLLEATE